MGQTTLQQAEGRKLTPMLRQYIDAKKQVPEDSILLFRMGDFFELFFEDARVAARELDIVLTARDKGADAIPMAGVPHHSITSYIARLVERGYTVAICDQVEDPKQAKGLVRREVTQLVTPGTVCDLESLDPTSRAYLACVEPAAAKGMWTLGFLDMLAGEVVVTECAKASLLDELHRMNTREVIARESTVAEIKDDLRAARLPLRKLEGSGPDPKSVRRTFSHRFGSLSIDGVPGEASLPFLLVVENLVHFTEGTQRRSLRHLACPRAYRIADYLTLDETTRNNLELVRTQREGKKEGSLLWHLNRCQTSLGTRTLSHWMHFPLRDLGVINERLDNVSAMKSDRNGRQNAQQALLAVRDIERLVGRIAVGRANPKDLGALRDSLVAAPAIKETLSQGSSPLSLKWREADLVSEVCSLLGRALVEAPPTAITDGGIFKLGYEEQLDQYIVDSTQGHEFLSELEERERVKTGIPKLKVRYNKVFGYFLEVSRANADKVPDHYLRKQTLVNAERFITEELKTFETRVLGADEKRKTEELRLYNELLDVLAGDIHRLRQLARLVGQTDATLALAEVADECRWARPEFSDDKCLRLTESRHPVVERLMPGGERFIPNNIELNSEDRRLMIVTGPNMGGKSTVMRQAAITVILAQMGSFVPARSATMSLSDRIFTRVGASDDLGRGHSTFMVEMLETSTILKEATDRSLVILDEVGRGTSTYDGVSIAWAVAESLYESVQCLAMFATHYHELTDLEVGRPGIVNACVAVRQNEGKILFLRELRDGAANRSYGIQVAGLAGLPDGVIERAGEILDSLERAAQGEPVATKRGERPQLSLFPSQSAESIETAKPKQGKSASKAEQVKARTLNDLMELDLNAMTPVQALVALDKLQKKLKKK